MPDDYQTIVFSQQDSIGIITLNRPEVLNAMNTRMLLEMMDLLRKIGQDETVRVVVIHGAGDRAFSAGADINEMKDNGPLQQIAYNRNWIDLFHMVEMLRKPVIAAVQGYAPGGGTELSLCCDLIIAADNAKFALAEIGIGVIPGAGATIRLTRWVGRGKAKEILMTGDFIDAAEGYRIGLVNKVVPLHNLLSEVMAFAAKLAQKSPLALGAAKAAVNIGSEMDLDRGIEYALNEFAILFSAEDQKEGMRAFLEKRPPLFKGK